MQNDITKTDLISMIEKNASRYENMEDINLDTMTGNTIAELADAKYHLKWLRKLLTALESETPAVSLEIQLDDMMEYVEYFSLIEKPSENEFHRTLKRYEKKVMQDMVVAFCDFNIID